MKKISWRERVRGNRVWVAVLGAAFLAACASLAPVELASSKTWQTRAVPLSQGQIKEEGGKRTQVRYPGFRETRSFEKWPTAARGSPEYFPPKKGEMPAGIKGDPKKGHELIRAGNKGPCTGCHLIPDAKVWPMGNVGPDLRAIGDRGLPDSHLFQVVYDPRVIFGADSPMAPFGASGIWTPEEIVHVVAYLQSLKGDPPGSNNPPKVTDDKQWNPFTRDVVRLDFGDARDITSNPALALTDTVAVPLWSKAGPKGQSCAGCHGAIGAADNERPLGVIRSMVGVGARYPRWFPRYGRMMSVEDFLSVHAPETTGHELPTQGEANLTMTVLVKMQSNGMPYQLDMRNSNVAAAAKRGEELFNRRVGQRGQACANCHTERGGAHKFLGGRFLAHIDKDAMMNHPYFRTSQGRLWDARIRFQWCMTPLLTNMLPGDAPEYADLETFIIAKQQGKPVNVPRSPSH
jgi:L-cysteine S-thiosulfotransferase